MKEVVKNMFEVVRYSSAWSYDGDEKVLFERDSIDECREYIKDLLMYHWRDLKEEYPSIKDVKEHHLYVGASMEVVIENFYLGSNFQDVMNGLKWFGYSFDGDVIEAYHEDWMEGCGGYYIRRV